jgi:hypothetical protein
MGCFAHSSPHVSQMFAHSAQMSRAHSLLRAIAPEANPQISAQSMSRAMQRAIDFTSGSCRHAVAQWWHAVAH